MSEKYLSGSVDLGVLGDRKVFVFKNDYKEGENDPTHKIYVSKGDGDDSRLVAVGALWSHEKGDDVKKEESVL